MSELTPREFFAMGNDVAAKSMELEIARLRAAAAVPGQTAQPRM